MVTLTGIDTDGDGLDNRFDSLNSTTNLKGTSYRMGNGGSFTGDATPGSRTPVQKTYSWQSDRDWRFSGIVLLTEMLQLKAMQQANKVVLSWTILSATDVDHFEVERSPDNEHYETAGILSETIKAKEKHQVSYTDDISSVTGSILYYRIKVINKISGGKMSNVQVVRRSTSPTGMEIIPNPVADHLSVNFNAAKSCQVTIMIVDNTGKTVLTQKQNVSKGSNTIVLTGLSRFSNSVYSLKLMLDDKVFTGNFILKN